MKLKELLRHTQGYIKVRIEESGKVIREEESMLLELNLPPERLEQRVGLIIGASEKAIRVSIMPRKD